MILCDMTHTNVFSSKDELFNQPVSHPESLNDQCQKKSNLY